MKFILISSNLVDTFDKLRIAEDISSAWDEKGKSGENKDPLLQEQEKCKTTVKAIKGTYTG